MNSIDESEEELTNKISISADYFNNVLYENVLLVVQTLYACISMDNKILVCATGENIHPSISFVNNLNRMSVPDNGVISAISLNADAQLISLIQQHDNHKIYSSQFKSFAKDQDLLILMPSCFCDYDLIQPLENLVKEAKNQGTMIILLSCSQHDDILTQHLTEDDIHVEIGDGDEFTSSIQLVITLQTILKLYNEFKIN